MEIISCHKGWKPFPQDPKTDGTSVLSLLILTISLPLQWNRKPCLFEISENSPFEPSEYVTPLFVRSKSPLLLNSCSPGRYLSNFSPVFNALRSLLYKFHEEEFPF